MEIENQEVIDIDIPAIESTTEEDPIPRRSSRIRRPPDRLNLALLLNSFVISCKILFPHFHCFSKGQGVVLTL